MIIFYYYSILALGLLSVDSIVHDYNSVLANMAVKALNGQKWLSYCVVADAGIVLSGGLSLVHIHMKSFHIFN
jgi:hypothetical protein